MQRNVFLKNKQILIGGTIILILVFLAVFAPFLSSYDYMKIDLENQLLPPGEHGHFLGTDTFGRDLWTRLVYGGRVSLIVSLLSVSFASIIGTILGMVCGYMGGRIDFIIGRIMDIMMAFPVLLLSLLLGVVLDPSIFNMWFIIGIPLIPSFYRVIRSSSMTVRERGYVRAARSMGGRHIYILRRHILPNVAPQFFVMFSFDFGSAIMAESALGFLGLGVPSPTPSWGLIINEGRAFIFTEPWLVGFSGLLIALAVFAFNMLGDGLRDCLEPR